MHDNKKSFIFENRIINIHFARKQKFIQKSKQISHNKKYSMHENKKFICNKMKTKISMKCSACGTYLSLSAVVTDSTCA
jgi:hypothetical protein